MGTEGTVGTVASTYCDRLVMDVGLFIRLLGFCLFGFFRTGFHVIRTVL